MFPNVRSEGCEGSAIVDVRRDFEQAIGDLRVVQLSINLSGEAS